jgi:serine/threonine protein phosphatase PrpC
MAEEQQKSFNVPFQVFGGSQNVIKSNDSSDSEDEQLVSDVFKGCYHQFAPSLMRDKVLVLASDGLWDNVHADEIRRELFDCKNYVESARRLVRRTK